MKTQEISPEILPGDAYQQALANLQKEQGLIIDGSNNGFSTTIGGEEVFVTFPAKAPMDGAKPSHAIIMRDDSGLEVAVYDPSYSNDSSGRVSCEARPADNHDPLQGGGLLEAFGLPLDTKEIERIESISSSDLLRGIGALIAEHTVKYAPTVSREPLGDQTSVALAA